MGFFFERKDEGGRKWLMLIVMSKSRQEEPMNLNLRHMDEFRLAFVPTIVEESSSECN
jgi:hypothetical protein